MIKNDKVIYKRSRFIYDELPLTKYRLGQYLLPHENNEYKYEFAKWYSGEICSVEVENSNRSNQLYNKENLI